MQSIRMQSVVTDAVWSVSLCVSLCLSVCVCVCWSLASAVLKLLNQLRC